MEKNGEYKEENETQPQKETQKEVYTPIEKNGMEQPSNIGVSIGNVKGVCRVDFY